VRVRHLALPVALFGLALAPAGAEGAVTIGSNLNGTGADNLPGYCPGGGTCTGTNLSLPAASTAANGLTSPMNGVVVRWRVKSGSGGNPVSLRVLRPAGGASYTGAGTSTPANTVTGTAETTSRVSIRAGDSIGLNIGNSALVWAVTPGANGLAWGSVNGFPNGLADGATATGAAQADRELLIQAVVEPDADGDGFGDETQDGCPGDATRQAPPCGTGPTNPLARPTVTGLRASPRSIRFGGRMNINFRLNRAARWTLRFEQARPGRVRRGRCRLQTRSLRTGRRCTHYTSRGTVSGTGGPGGVRVVFRGALANRRTIPAGRYRVTATARSAGGTSAPKRTFIRLRPRLLR
jgi:hypothetical protein